MLAYDLGFGQSSAIFLHLWKMFRNIFVAVGQILENLLKVVQEIFGQLLIKMFMYYGYNKNKSCGHCHWAEITRATLDIGLVAIKD